jgi:hypothetical protein
MSQQEKHTFYTYLINSENKLVITRQKFNNKDYTLLMDTSGNNESYLLSHCKTFCAGYVLGNKSEPKIINRFSEFTK